MLRSGETANENPLIFFKPEPVSKAFAPYWVKKAGLTLAAF